MSSAEEYQQLGPLEVRIRTHAQFSERQDDIAGAVLATLQLDRTASVLDVGCGTGAFLSRLKGEQHQGRLVGIDSSAAAVDALLAAGVAEAHLGSAMELPFRDAEFDAVTAMHMLYHVDDPDLAVREAYRVLKPNGQFVATVNHPAGLPILTGIASKAVESRGLPVSDVGEWVNSSDLPDRMDRVFGNVEVIRQDNALLISSPGPAADFVVAILGIYGVPDGHPDRADVELDARRLVDEWFASNPGPLRDGKGYAICRSFRGSHERA